MRSLPLRPLLMRSLLLLVCCLSLAACGFQLRGPKPMPFKTIFLEMDPYADLTASIKRSIESNGSTKVVDVRDDAEVRMVVVANSRDKEILSLNANGTVREYQLRLRFAYRLYNKAGSEVTPLSVIEIHRDFNFNDSQVLAKEQEETQMYREMENDLVQQLMRRLAAAKM